MPLNKETVIESKPFHSKFSFAAAVIIFFFFFCLSLSPSVTSAAKSGHSLNATNASTNQKPSSPLHKVITVLFHRSNGYQQEMRKYLHNCFFVHFSA